MRAPLRLVALATPLALLALPVAGAQAAASPIRCDATALTGSLLGQALGTPLSANRGAAACATSSTPTTQDLSATGLPLSGGVLFAATRASGTQDTQKGYATAGLANAAIGRLDQLGLALPDVTALLPALLRQPVPVPLPSSALPGPLSTLLGTLGVTLPTSLDVNLLPALLAQVQGLPSVDVLDVGGATATAAAACSAGSIAPVASSQVSGLKVLGQDVPTGAPSEQTLSAIDAQAIDPSTLLPTDAQLTALLTATLQGVPNLPAAQLSAVVSALLAPVRTGLQSALDALPTIAIPATLATVKVTPNVQTKAADGTLTQDALRIQVALLGRSLADVLIGEARINTTGVDCAKATPVPAENASLQCTERKLVLTDVVREGDRVRLFGAAAPTLVGKRVRIRFAADGSTAARPKVRRDGSFTATAKLPAARLRSSNRARYQASVGKETSLDLKLQRRMSVTSLTDRAGKVTIRGRVTSPLARPAAAIRVQRRVSCKRLQTVKTIRPRADGTFSVTVAAPTGTDSAVYRLATRVRKSTKNRKTYPTFTLPRGVNLT